jgi:hypothetical protein
MGIPMSNEPQVFIEQCKRPLQLKEISPIIRKEEQL